MKQSSTARCASFAIAVICLVASVAAAEEAQSSAAPGKALGRRHFETRIAPLFARHCLECHDSVATEGGLDLSRKERAFRGGDNGPVLLPGKAAESPLWKSVNANTMPHNRAPLSDSEKVLLKEWIDAGASWPIDVIDASAYVNNDRAGGTFLQRLTVREYIETVRATVGVDIAPKLNASCHAINVPTASPIPPTISASIWRTWKPMPDWHASLSQRWTCRPSSTNASRVVN